MTNTKPTMVGSMNMNPMERIASLELRVAVLEQQQHNQAPAKETISVEKKADSEMFPARFSQECADLLIFAWHEVTANGQRTTIDAWMKAANLLDTDNILPSLHSRGDSLRLLLCEHYGLHVKWSGRPPIERHDWKRIVGRKRRK